MSARDVWAREVLLRAWPKGLGTPTRVELQAVQAVGRHEGFYGYAQRPLGWYGSNNWGAVHCSNPPPCGDDCFEARDSHADGSVYVACFKAYATPEAGALDLITNLYRRPAVRAVIRSGDLLQLATAMRRTGYHETKPEVYGKALARNATALASSLGEPLAVRFTSSGGDALVLALLAWAIFRWG